MYKYESVESFYNEIPYENKEDRGDFIYSLLFFAVLRYVKKDIYSSVKAIEDILLLSNERSPREWECIEWATFLLIYIKRISPDEAGIYLSTYKRRLFRYYFYNESRFKMFYKNLNRKKIIKEIKNSLKRRWDKKNLNISVNSLNISKENNDLKMSWIDSVEVFLESVFLSYLVGNIDAQFIKDMEKYMSELLELVGDEKNITPFVGFYNL